MAAAGDASRATDGTPGGSAPRWVPIGRVRRAHGVRGELAVEAFGDTLQGLVAGDPVRLTAASGALRAETRIRSLRGTGGPAVLVAVEGVDDRDAAAALRGVELSVPRSRLAPLAAGEYYCEDLLGLDVRTEDGRSLGRLTAIVDLGPHDLWSVREGDRETLLPATDEVLREVDLERRVAVVRLLDESDGAAPEGPAAC